jgi:hypothetical protein
MSATADGYNTYDIRMTGSSIPELIAPRAKLEENKKC